MTVSDEYCPVDVGSVGHGEDVAEIGLLAVFAGSTGLPEPPLPRPSNVTTR
jgi:hypothetical protein